MRAEDEAKMVPHAAPAFKLVRMRTRARGRACDRAARGGGCIRSISSTSRAALGIRTIEAGARRRCCRRRRARARAENEPGRFRAALSGFRNAYQTMRLSLKAHRCIFCARFSAPMSHATTSKTIRNGKPISIAGWCIRQPAGALRAWCSSRRGRDRGRQWGIWRTCSQAAQDRMGRGGWRARVIQKDRHGVIKVIARGPGRLRNASA